MRAPSVVLAFTALLAAAKAVPSAQIWLHGVSPKLEARYGGPASSASFRCLDGSRELPWDRVNDDYCDCEDGSDEPGTSACAQGHFYCRNEGFTPLTLVSSRVGDTLCDCCDGSDELSLAHVASSGAIEPMCPNTCAQLAHEATKEIRARLAEVQAGLAKKTLVTEAAAAQYNAKVARRDELSTLIAAQQALVEEKRVEKERLEAEETVEKERRQAIWEEERAKIEDADKDVKIASLQSKIAALEAQIAAKDAEILRLLTGGAAPVAPAAAAAAVEEDAEPERFPYPAEYAAPAAAAAAEAAPEAPDAPSTGGGGIGLPVAQGADADAATAAREAEFEASEAGEENEPQISVEWADYSSEEAETARNAWTDASSKLTELENEKKDLDDLIALDFGADREFFSLHGRCISAVVGKYTYEVCPFDKASQKEGSSSTSIGTFDKWTAQTPSRVMRFDNGQKCWQGPSRSLEVTLECSAEERVYDVQEPSKCAYAAKFSTPSACSQSDVDALEAQLAKVLNGVASAGAKSSKDEL